MFSVVMFLPQTQKTVRKVIPISFNFIDLPSSPVAEPSPNMQEASPVPVVDKAVPEKPKPVPEKSAATKAIMSELDDVLKKEKKVPEKKVVQSKAPVLEDTFQKLNTLKEKKVPEKKSAAMPLPKPKEKILEGFEDIKKMKDKVKPKAPPSPKPDPKKDLKEAEQKFEQLAALTPNSRPKDKPRKSSEILKDLKDLEKFNEKSRAALDKPKTQNRPPSKSSQLLKQLESLKHEKVQIKIDTTRLTSKHSPQFKSEIRDMKLAKLSNPAVAPPGALNPGDPAADVLSKYVGEIYAKVMANWKDPLGGGSGQVHVSFTVFPRGNIAAPEIRKGSGDSKLDILAVRAVKNAVPLPPFPKELKEPNLPLIFEFKYVPSKK